jgi:PAS domain S-box-containing protein
MPNLDEAVLEGLPFGVLQLDREGRLASASAPARALLRPDPEHPLRLPEHLDGLFERLARAGNTPWETFYGWARRLLAGAAVEPLEFALGLERARRLTALATAHGWLLLVEDRTADARRERLLAELEDFVRGGVWELDLEDQTLSFSNGLWSLFGPRARERLGSLDRWLSYVEPDHRAPLQAYIEECVAEGKPYRATYPMELPEGGRLVIEARGRVVADGAGRPRSAIGVFQDVTEREARDAALRHSERLFRSILEASADIVTMVDGEVLRFVSPSVREILGHEPEALEGVAPLDLVHEDDRARIDELFRQLESAGEGTLRTGCRLRHADGGWREMELSARPGPFGPASGHSVVIARDVTRERETERRLRQAEKLEALGQLAGGVAHDFNNLLTTILGNAELIEADGGAGDGARTGAAQIREAASRASDLTRQLLGFTRRSEPARVAVDVCAVIEQAVAMLRRSVDKRVEVLVEQCAEAPWIEGDTTSLHTALLNLGLNARDALPEQGGVVRFRCSTARLEAERTFGGSALPPGDYVRVEVADTGTGMPPEVLERIFDPFFTTKPQGRGTGLGLASVYGCARSHRGAVEVTSTLGAGSCFSLLLPRSAAGVPSSAAAPRREAGTVGGHVVVVDDEAGIRELLATALGDAGLAVTAFAGGAEALAWFREHHRDADLVLLDMSMPGMSGAETFDALRAVDPAARVIVTSGYALVDAPEDLLDRGAVDYVLKPFRVAQLLDRIGRALRAGRP